MLTEACGSSFAGRFLSAARAASLRRITTPTQHPSPPSAGGAQGSTRRRARAHFNAGPIKDANAPDVRRQARLLLEICGWLRPWKERGSRRTGHEGQEHKLNKRNLSARLGVSTKEIERYLTVMEDAGVVRRWQPPADSGMPKGNISGHCFSVYELVGEMPAPLRLELEGWHGRAQQIERAEVAAQAVAPAKGDARMASVHDGNSALEAVRKLRGPP